MIRWLVDGCIVVWSSGACGDCLGFLRRLSTTTAATAAAITAMSNIGPRFGGAGGIDAAK